MANLRFLAGAGARKLIERDGFDGSIVGTIAGASGGAKWLILSRLDQAILERLLPQFRSPVHLVASSIGAWRFACYSQPDPIAAIQKFEAAYVNQRYSENPTRRETTELTRKTLDLILGKDGAHAIISNPLFRFHVMTVRTRSIAASEYGPVLGASLLLSAVLNVFNRRTLGGFYIRSLFYDARDLPPFIDLKGFPFERTPVSVDNVADVIAATGAIPLVLEGVRDIAGAPPGVYRDGGVIDYHLDFQTSVEGKLTLYPHFFSSLTPGWFDKKLNWRRNSGSNTDRTLVICPSPDFVARLPGAKIPDRTDFQSMSQELRIKVWQTVVDACDAMADEFREVLDKGSMVSRLEDL